MSVELVRLLPFNNVVGTGLANVDLQNLLGYSIDTIYLVLGGTTFDKTMVTDIKLKANGKIIYDSTGAATDLRMRYRNLAADAAILAIDFTEAKARTRNGLMGGSLDTTLGVKNLRLEIQTTGATNPTLSGWAAVSPPQVTPDFAALRPLIARVHRMQQTIGAAGTFPLQVPHMDPTQGGSLFKRITFFSSNMTGLLVQRNGITEHDSTKQINEFRQRYEGERTPQSSVYVFDPIVDNLQEGRVFDTRPAAGTQTVLIQGTFSGAETITCEVEVLEPLDVY